MNDKEKGARLKQAIEDSGYTIKSFAEFIGAPPSTIYGIANGSRPVDGVSYKLYKSMAHGLGMSSDELHNHISRTDYAVVQIERPRGIEMEVVNDAKKKVGGSQKRVKVSYKPKTRYEIV